MSADTTTIRRAVCPVSIELLKAALKLPDNVQIIAAQVSVTQAWTIDLLLESPDFPESYFGQRMPRAQATYVYTRPQPVESPTVTEFSRWVITP